MSLNQSKMFYNKKILFIVIDGLADEKIPSLSYKTPLEAAKKPNLDFLIKEGRGGLVTPFYFKKEIPTSEDCHLALFGYHPLKNNPGRGVLEALGLGLKIKKDDVCFRGNFATIDDNLKIIDRRAGRVSNTEILIKSLNRLKIEKFKEISFFLKKSFGHRFVLVLRGKNLSEKVTSNDPKKNNEFVLKIEPKTKNAKKTADFLNEFLKESFFLLKNHPFNKKRKLPVNFLLLRGAGKLKKVETFEKKYGLKACVIAGGTLYKGIGIFLGMKEIKVLGANGMKDTNLKGKILTAKKFLKKYDFVFLHIKATDTFAEDGDFKGKKEFIEKIDRNLKEILSLKNTVIVITGDHATCSLLKSHCHLPNPLLVFGLGRDKVSTFSERACQKGSLGKIPQLQLLKIIFKLILTPN